MNFLGLKYLPLILACLAMVSMTIIWARHSRKITLQKLASDGSGMPSLQTTASPRRRRIRTIAIVAVLILIGITILRPTGGTIITENRLPAKNLIILFDASKSMGVADVGGLTRLETAQLYAREFIDARPADRIGLVSFDGIAFPECPATLSRNMLLSRLEMQSPGGLRAHGSDLQGALKSAAKLLTENPPPGSAIILMSDGDRLTDDTEASTAPIAEINVPIHTITFGDKRNETPIPKSNLSSKANPGMMREIAENTGGIHLEAEGIASDGTIRSLGARIDTMKLDNSSEFAADLQNRPLELYAYPLSLALALLFLRLFLPTRANKKWYPLTPAFILGFSFIIVAQPSHAQSPQPPQLPDALPATTSYQPFVDALVRAQEKKLPLVVLFTGSDWSEASIAFETEIAANSIFTDWAERRVVLLTVDIPRSGIDASTRTARRSLASRLAVSSFPTAVFLDVNETELGRLAHDPDGPAAWVKRAELILEGNRAASTIESSVDELPPSIREYLEETGIEKRERAMRYYNQALEFTTLEPILAKQSPDRFILIDDLLATASSLTTHDDLDLEGTISALRANHHHQRGRAFLPPRNAAANPLPLEALGAGNPIEPNPEQALRIFKDAHAYYQDTVRATPNSDNISENLAILETDVQYANDLIAFRKAYQQAVKDTRRALDQETAFRDSLVQWVTVKDPVNDPSIADAKASIKELVRLGEIVNAPMLDELRNAEEDILLAPDPHTDRQLESSRTDIQNAYNHLVTQQQPQSGEGGESDPFAQPSDDQSDGEGEGDEPQPSPNQAGGDRDLKRSENGKGDLRDRQLEQLGRDARRRGRGAGGPGGLFGSSPRDQH